SPAAWGGTADRADCRPGSRPVPSPSPTPACTPPVRPGGASTSAESGDCTGAPCRRGPPPPPSSCCRRCRVGRPRRKTGTPCRGRRRPSTYTSTLGLAEVDAHVRHAAVRQLHVRRLDHQRQPLKRDRL